MVRLLSLVSGGWGYVAAALFAAALSVGITHWIDAKGYGIEIADLQKQIAQKQALDVSASLTQLQTFISNVQNASNGYQATLAEINARFAQLQKDYKNAKPLPLDCKPDPVRLRILTDAVSATHKAPTAIK